MVKRMCLFRIVTLVTLVTLVTVIFFAQSLRAQPQKISIDLKQVSLQNLFSAIEKQTPYKFTYRDGTIDSERDISISKKDASVEEILREILPKKKLDFTINASNSIVIFEKKRDATQGQPKRLMGVVIDQSGEPLIGANVSVKGTTNSTITDIDGKFSLDVTQGNTLLVSYIGYTTKETPITSQSSYNITLTEDMQKLEEVVVIGYGTRKKQDISTAISHVGSETLEKSISLNVVNALQGTMTGVQISGNSGNPLARPTVRIRGTNTWGTSDPLYVIDGVPIAEYGQSPLNVMNLINPDDIESVSVLKDASSAAIYGVRAANGVILITTKKGRNQAPVVNLSVRAGVANMHQEIDYLNTPQYTKFVQDIYATDPKAAINQENLDVLFPNSPRYLGNSPTYDWQKYIKYANAPTRDYNLSLMGGSEKVDYYVSAGYSKVVAPIQGSDLERVSTAFKLNSQFNKNIKAGVNYKLSYGGGRNDNGLWMGHYTYWTQAAPWQPVESIANYPEYNGYK